MTDPFIRDSRWPKQQVFQEALKLRLLIAPMLDYIGEDRICRCSAHGDEPIRASEKPFHSLVCSWNRGIFVDRYNSIRDRLALLLRQVCSPGSSIIIEPTMANGSPLAYRPDIAIEKAGTVEYIDIVVADPTSRNAMEPTLTALRGGLIRNGFAADLAQQRKANTYRDLPYNVVPFALESTGLFGPMAIDFLSLRCKDHPRALRAFYRDCSLILAHSLGRSSLAGRARFSN